MKITLDYGEHFDRVLVDDEELPLEPSLAVYNHSPSGFAWGYHGSGPSQLALALLLHAGVEERTAVRLHQRFKEEFVAAWLDDGPGSVQVLNIDPKGWARAEVRARKDLGTWDV